MSSLGQGLMGGAVGAGVLMTHTVEPIEPGAADGEAREWAVAPAADDSYREVRVHGIGDHGPLSAQGSGIVKPPTPEQVAAGVDVSAPPAAPDHPVRYLNWSRTSRSKVRLFWYVAFPYTLVNTAAFMCPRDGRGQRPHRALVVVWGAVLTAVTVLWVIAVAETVLRFGAGGRGSPWASAVAPLCAGAVVPVVIAFRAVKHGGPRSVTAGWEVPASALWANFAAALATVVAAALWTPARDTVPARASDGRASCLIGPDGTDCVVYDGDWVTIAAFGSISVAVIVLLALACASLVSRDRTWQGEEASPLLGTGLALLTATVALHVGWSAFLIAVSSILGYLDQWYFLPFLDRWTGTHPFDGLVLPFDAGTQVPGETQAAFVYGPHLVSILLIAPVAVVMLLYLAVRAMRAAARRVFRRGRVPEVPSPETVKAMRMHRWITATSGAGMTTVILGLLTGWAVWLVAAGDYLSDPPARGRPSAPIAAFIGLQHAVLVAFLLLAFVRDLRRPLAVVGDVVGFWNLSAHPLAALPYRNGVVTAIRSEIAGSDRMALVGHSQGSVLCFTALLERAREERAAREGETHPAGPDGTSVNRPIDLVTCGSPIASLYGRFFPRFFSATQIDLVNSTVSTWKNFWRDTDPIATAVGAKNGDEKLTDPLPDLPLRRHGDYWVDDSQNGWIEERTAAAGSELLRKRVT